MLFRVFCRFIYFLTRNCGIMNESSKIGRGLTKPVLEMLNLSFDIQDKQKFDSELKRVKGIIEDRFNKNKVKLFNETVRLKRQGGKTELIARAANAEDLIIFSGQVFLKEFENKYPDCTADKAYVTKALKGAVFFNPEMRSTWNPIKDDFSFKKYRVIWIDDADHLEMRPDFNPLVFGEQLACFSKMNTSVIMMKTE